MCRLCERCTHSCSDHVHLVSCFCDWSKANSTSSCTLRWNEQETNNGSRLTSLICGVVIRPEGSEACLSFFCRLLDQIAQNSPWDPSSPYLQVSSPADSLASAQRTIVEDRGLKRDTALSRHARIVRKIARMYRGFLCTGGHLYETPVLQQDEPRKCLSERRLPAARTTHRQQSP